MISGKAIGVASSAADYTQIQELVGKVECLEGVDGKLDILIANAGATWGSRFEDLPDEAGQKILDLNVRGVYNLARG
jgi:NAD(P)-dependent dehydrogenase (short-subunit alcohol dehydrogenase family)